MHGGTRVWDVHTFIGSPPSIGKKLCNANIPKSTGPGGPTHLRGPPFSAGPFPPFQGSIGSEGGRWWDWAGLGKCPGPTLGLLRPPPARRRHTALPWNTEALSAGRAASSLTSSVPSPPSPSLKMGGQEERGQRGAERRLSTPKPVPQPHVAEPLSPSLAALPHRGERWLREAEELDRGHVVSRSPTGL